MCKKHVFFIFIIVTINLFAAEQTEKKEEKTTLRIVVTEKKDKNEEDASSKTVVSAKEMEQKQYTDTADVLNNLPGIHLSKAGNPGSISSIYVRGLRSDHVLLTLDGIPLNSAMSLNGSPNTGYLPVDHLHSVTFIRGVQTVLYGPDALAGVIALKTKKGSGSRSFSIKPQTGDISVDEQNNYPNYAMLHARLEGSTKTLAYNVSLNFLTTKALSMAGDHENLSNNKYLEKDGFNHGSLSTYTAYKNDFAEFSLRSYFSLSESDIDDGGGQYRDDPDRTLSITSGRIFPEMIIKYKSWQQRIGASLSVNTMVDKDPQNTHISYLGAMRAALSGRDLEIFVKERFAPVTWSVTKAGMIYKRGWGSLRFSKKDNKPFRDDNSGWMKQHTIGFYLFNRTTLLEQIELSGGMRIDGFYYDKIARDSNNEHLINNTVQFTKHSFQAGIVWNIPGMHTHLRASLGSGHKAPTLYQLSTNITSEAKPLKPQSAFSFDAGVIQYFFKKHLKLEAIFFDNHINDYIDFDYAQRAYRNRYYINTRGFEFVGKFKINHMFRITASYTMLTDMTEYSLFTFRDKTYAVKHNVLRRPKHMISGEINFRWKRKFNINLSGRYSGEKADMAFNVPKTPYPDTVAAFFTLDLAMSYCFTKNVKMFFRVANLTDNQYEEIIEYASPGISIFAGGKLTI